LLIADRESMHVLEPDASGVSSTPQSAASLWFSDRQGVGGFDLPHVQRLALDPPADFETILQSLAQQLLLDGTAGAPELLRRGVERGTVSSSLIAVHRDDPTRTVFRYAPGSPDTTAYADYSNLAKRLIR
jgi:hypothetical protein